MAKLRKVHDSGFKARVALDAVKERETVSQLAKRHDVHPTQVHEWKRRLLDQASSVFDRGNSAKKTEDFDAAELYEEIGRLKMELDWVKKKAAQFGQ
jgi:putative transposase